ncbi:MAG: YdiU family protein [Elainellaceae cyanobacterium]
MLPEATPLTRSSNPFLDLTYEPAFESLGGDYSDGVAAAEFPRHILRFRNDELLPLLGLEPEAVTDADFLVAFGHFRDRQPLLAMRYHGFQFGEYNPYLGDGRGFLYGQVRGTDGELYDFGTKGSGTTPYSRSGDGRLTLKGGVREVIAAEALHRYGVKTSRCLSLVETGDSLWRGDEPSPTRASVMVRFNRSHIRFGTFERLHYFQRPDLVEKLLDHVVDVYYPHLNSEKSGSQESGGQESGNRGDTGDAQASQRYARFYAELVQRVAELAAQWMAAGFCHAVLNTDNMSITGESFDYGPYAFIDEFDPRFTAAYFDHGGRYCYANQPRICKWNLEMLQIPLKMVIPEADLEAGLAQFDDYYFAAYDRLMLNKLGFDQLAPDLTTDLMQATLKLLLETQVGYHDFFLALRHQVDSAELKEGVERSDSLLSNLEFAPAGESSQLPPRVRAAMAEAGDGNEPENSEDAVKNLLAQWRSLYGRSLQTLSQKEREEVPDRLSRHNPDCVPLRPAIESIWEPITLEDNWQPFYDLVERIRTSVEP